jgi:hypothetical protein
LASFFRITRISSADIIVITNYIFLFTTTRILITFFICTNILIITVDS